MLINGQHGSLTFFWITSEIYELLVNVFCTSLRRKSGYIKLKSYRESQRKDIKSMNLQVFRKELSQHGFGWHSTALIVSAQLYSSSCLSKGTLISAVSTNPVTRVSNGCAEVKVWYPREIDPCPTCSGSHSTRSTHRSMKCPGRWVDLLLWWSEYRIHPLLGDTPTAH